MYVTDGTTNATLPKDVQPEELTQAQALELLAARAAQGPSKSAGRKARRAAPKRAKGEKPAKATKAPKARVKKPAAKARPAGRKKTAAARS
jgi:DNA topoisomerase-1